MNKLTDFWIEMMRVRNKIRYKCAKLKVFKEKAEKRLHALHKIRDELGHQLERLHQKKKRHIGPSRHMGKVMMYRRWQRSWKLYLEDQEKKLKKLSKEEKRVDEKLYKLHTQLEKKPQLRQKMKNIMNNFEDSVTETPISWNTPMEGKENLKMHHANILKIRKTLRRFKKSEKEDLQIEGLQKFWDTQLKQKKKSPKSGKVKAVSHSKTDGTPDSISQQLFKMHKDAHDKLGFEKKIRHSSLHTKKKHKKTTFADAVNLGGNMIPSAESSKFTENETEFKSTSKRRHLRKPSAKRIAKRTIVTPLWSAKSAKSTPTSQDPNFEITKLTGEQERNMVDTIQQKLVNRSTSLMELERANQVMEQAKANATKKQTHGKRPSDQHRLSALRSQARRSLPIPRARRWTFYKKYVNLTGGKHAGAGLFKMLEERQDEKYQQLHRLLSDIINGPTMLDALQDSTEVYENVLNHYMWSTLLEVFNDLKGMPKHVILQVLKAQYLSFIDEIVTHAIEGGAQTIVDEYIQKTPPAEPMELPNTLASGNDSFDAYIDHSLELIELNPSSFRSSKTTIDRQSLEDQLSLERLLSEQLERMIDRYSLDNLKKIYEAHAYLFGQMDSKWPSIELKKKKSKLKRKQASKQVKPPPRVSPTRLFDAPHRTCRERKADEMCAECSCDEEQPRCERCGDALPALYATPEESVTQLSRDTIEACGKNQQLIEWTRDICYQCGYVHQEQLPCPMIWPQAEAEDCKRLRYLRMIKEFARNEQRLQQLCPTRQSMWQLQWE